MFNLSSVEAKRNTQPPRIIIYGVPKIGKTTFAAQAHDPIIIDLEGGSDNLEVARVERNQVRSLADILEVLRALYREDHNYKTVVLDSIDWLERILFEEVARENGARAIDDFSVPGLRFGRGYTMAQNKLKEFLAAMDALRMHKGMSVILICHSAVRKHDDPEEESFDHHTLKLNEKIKAIVQEWSDCILFARQKVYVTTSTSGHGKEVKKGRSGNRVLHTQGCASYLAGNRYGLPEELPLDFKAFWKEFTAKTNYTHAAIQPAKAKTGKVVPITTPTTTPSMGTSPAAYQNANGVYNHAEYLEL